ncbi:putative mediator of RNA polymerase II transcription subunit 26b [Capsicum chacoense]
MANICEKLSKWREYFVSSKTNIFEIIELAIIISAIDHPKEFKLKRDRVAQLLFSCKITRGNGCDKVEFVVPNADNVVTHADKDVPNTVNVDVDDEEEPENSSDEEEEESRIIKEVLRNKSIIDDYRNETDLSVYVSLRELRKMDLTLETLKATGIGKSVNALRKHKSANIQNLAKKMVENWSEMVNEYWLKAQAAFADAERIPESPKATVAGEEEERLPSIPLEDLSFVLNQATSFTLSRVLDGLDDDGNALSSGQTNNHREVGRKASNPVSRQQNVTAAPEANPVRRQQNVTAAPNESNPVRRQQNVTAASKVSNPVSRQQNVTAAPEANPVRRQQNITAASKVSNLVSRQQNVTAAPEANPVRRQQNITAALKVSNLVSRQQNVTAAPEANPVRRQQNVIAASKVSNPVSRHQNVTAAPEAKPVRRHQNVTAAPNVSNPVRRQQNVTVAPKDKKGDHQKKQTSLAKPNKPPADNSMPGRPIKPTFQRKLNNDDMKFQHKSDRSKIQTRPVPTQPNKLKRPQEDAEQVKLEAAKRKLQERYQEVERAKRQRVVQVVELRDMHKKEHPKHGPRAGNPHMRPANHNRPLVNRRQ